MANLQQEMVKNVGKWKMVHTKFGSYYGKIESVNNRGVTMLIPSFYDVSPSMKLIEKNIDVKAEDFQGERFFRRPFRRFHRFFFPFLFLLPFLFI
ncbi:hypothetical protein PP175_02050 [Aneurinibacillus sp. Ricciae_BoGa-3]|uniref:hypothetical protein n=1 Tax=Aneurinibacillus sp. Ricciae_BoGa-3 TaxID=3022697 RepID=UPI002340BF7F|nr:hypothetical protein [Aneurinibacillus sp. Ricciae_BoGa-3]WCK54825.1 hypothetical protein PP175_02050 [Aneurinibacillus sp. Ricciae_BoGa-3]